MPKSKMKSPSKTWMTLEMRLTWTKRKCREKKASARKEMRKRRKTMKAARKERMILTRRLAVSTILILQQLTRRCGMVNTMNNKRKLRTKKAKVMLKPINRLQARSRMKKRRRSRRIKRRVKRKVKVKKRKKRKKKKIQKTKARLLGVKIWM